MWNDGDTGRELMLRERNVGMIQGKENIELAVLVVCDGFPGRQTLRGGVMFEGQVCTSRMYTLGTPDMGHEWPKSTTKSTIKLKSATY